MSKFIENPGVCPSRMKGKKVDVLLRKKKDNGYHVRSGPWPADGKGACNWKLSRPAKDPEGYPFDIVAYKEHGT